MTLEKVDEVMGKAIDTVVKALTISVLEYMITLGGYILLGHNVLGLKGEFWTNFPLVMTLWPITMPLGYFGAIAWGILGVMATSFLLVFAPVQMYRRFVRKSIPTLLTF